MDGGGQMLAAASRRTDQQHARPAGGGQFDLSAGEAHGVSLSDESIGPIACGGLLAKSTDGLMQGDWSRVGGLGRLFGGGLGRSIGASTTARIPNTSSPSRPIGKKRARRSIGLPSSATRATVALTTSPDKLLGGGHNAAATASTPPTEGMEW